MDTSSEYLFDDYFDTINLNEELIEFYKFINDDELNKALEKETYLTNLRNENYKRYNDINLLSINNLSDEFEIIVNEIKKLYSFISPDKILSNNEQEAQDNKKIIDLIYEYLNQLNNKVEEKLNILEQENNDRQEKIKEFNYNFVDKTVLHEILNGYNNIVLYNSIIEDNVYDNFKRQIRRKKDINKLYRLINLEIDDISNDKNEINILNKEITKEVKNIYNKITYLEDLMMEKSEYEGEFLLFKNYLSSLIAYDDTDYTDLNRVYNSIYKEKKIQLLLNYFEESFIKEIEKVRREETFIYEKYGIKNMKKALDYIKVNYIDEVEEYEKIVIENISQELNSDNYDLSNLYNNFRQVVNNIWKKFVTDVYSYNEQDDFCFICSNSEFIDEKYQTIIITKRMLERVNDYSDYQIGFICNYNNNILYITESENIMDVDYNDMSNLKTPKQIEQEFLNFRVSNRIALNGFLTNVVAVYIINDGDMVKYKKAVEIANQYKLPLISLRKNKN